MAVFWNGNRHNEKYIFRRVSWDNFQEHETYNYITSGNIEYSADADLKVTGSFSFEGYVLPDVNDLLRVYYSFKDDNGLEAYEPLCTLFISYAELTYEDTLKGIRARGFLDGSSVLKVLQDKLTGRPYTVKKNENAVYLAEDIVRECGLDVNITPSSSALTSDHTFDSGTDYLEIVNWLLETADYTDAYPDANGVVQMKPLSEVSERTDYYTFHNNDESIMYPEVSEENDWQETPNVVRLLYNTDDSCIAATAKNETGSRASLDKRGGREITYFEEVSDIEEGTGRQYTLMSRAESILKEKSCDIEYVTISHAFVPVYIYDPVMIKYGDEEWSGNADNISIDLSPSTKTQLKIKRTLYDDIVISRDSHIYREE